MPEIDNDLFKVLVPALLAIAALLLLALLASLSGIRKVLKQQLTETRELRDAIGSGGVSGPSAASEPEPAGLEAAPQSETPYEAPSFTPEPGPVVGGAAAIDAKEETPTGLRSLAPEEGAAKASSASPWDQASEPSAAAPQSADTSGGTEDPFATPAQADAQDDPFAASTSSGDDRFSSSNADDPFAAPAPGADDPFSSPAAETPEPSVQDPFGAPTSAASDDSPAPAADDPFAAQSTSAGDDEDPFGAGSGEPVSQSAVDEPDEQPFERNGRWFFRRDDELLVYEEGTGEWVPADPADTQPAAPPPAASPEYTSPAAESTGSTADDYDSSGPEDTARFDTVEDDPRPTAGGGFWKCPSCGAVNGSSAATCRMCFSARP